MPYHEFKFQDFIGKNLEPFKKVYLLGGMNILAEMFISQGMILYDYKIVVKNRCQLWCLFEDEEGDQYSLICLMNGQHITNYNSKAPNMTKLYVKGDELEKYQDLRISEYEP